MGLIWFPLAILVGGLACTSSFFAIFAVGWTARFSVRRWGEPWPGWVLGPGPGVRSRLLGGLWTNFTTGLAQVLGTALLLGPATACWAFGWRYGWEASFYKAYDTLALGPAFGLLGLLLFGVAMLVVPLAQARHAQTHDLRAFTDLPALSRMTWERPVGALLLAAAHALAGLPVMIMWMIPVFVGRNQAYETWTVAEQVGWVQRYGWVAATAFFPAFVTLRWLAVRWYRGALAASVRAGRLPEDRLLPGETADPAPREQGTGWRWTRVPLGPVRSALVAATVLVWMIMGSQLFVANFFHYRPLVGWNVPLVELPVFAYLPDRT